MNTTINTKELRRI